MAYQKQEKQAKVLLSNIEKNINKLPWPRKIETIIYSAQACVQLKNHIAASSLAEFAYKRSADLGMWGWAFEALLILSQHSSEKEKYKKRTHLLFQKICAVLPPNQASILKNRLPEDA